MSVLKSKRTLSGMEFYRCAEKIQDDITDFVLRDFGLKRSPRTVRQVVRDIDETDQAAVDGIFAKYGKRPDQSFASVYPEWFVGERRLRLMRLADRIVDDVIEANSVYCVTVRECDMRRERQDDAIGACNDLHREFQYLRRHLPINVNWLSETLSLIEREKELLKGWRQSDAKRRRAVVEKEFKEVAWTVSSSGDEAGADLTYMAKLFVLLRR